MLSAPIFNSRIKSENVTKKEKILGYFFGPISVSVMTCILTNYLNVYYTDVVNIAAIGGGLFLSLFPVICKIIDAFTFVVMGRIVDRTSSPQGKARPWILLSTPILLISMIMLFAVPEGNDWIRATWIFLSYNLFYSIGYTAYSTSHSLMVPLATSNQAQRSSLSLVSNSLYMLSGAFLTIVFPCILIPAMGVNRTSWMTVIGIITLICCPLLLFEYYFTVERVTMTEQKKTALPSLKEQLRLCLKSRQWIVYVLYILIMQLFNALSSTSIFYYCNWVLGSYNDGITQALFYAVGNAPMGLGVFLCQPICRIFGRRRAISFGFLLSAAGCLLCFLNPTSLPLVLIGQIIKSIGLIPSSFMGTTLMADALDDVEKASGTRCDGFSSSTFNIITTLSSGVAMGIFNFFLTRLGYLAPSAAGATLPVQNGAIQGFFSFCALGAPIFCYLLAAILLHFSESKRERKLRRHVL